MDVALITGGNAGIGEAVVRSLAKTPNYHVTTGSRRLDSGNELANCFKEQGHSVSAIQLDITRRALKDEVSRRTLFIYTEAKAQ